MLVYFQGYGHPAHTEPHLRSLFYRRQPNECSQAKSLLVTRLRLRFSFVQRFQVLVTPHLTLSDNRTVRLFADRSESAVMESLREEIGARASHSATRARCGLNQHQRQWTTAQCLSFRWNDVASVSVLGGRVLNKTRERKCRSQADRPATSLIVHNRTKNQCRPPRRHIRCC